MLRQFTNREAHMTRWAELPSSEYHNRYNPYRPWKRQGWQPGRYYRKANTTNPWTYDSAYNETEYNETEDGMQDHEAYY